jgi:acyl-CoA thioesterase FadM
VAGIPLYQTAILPEWIDYNGHLRDAYYGLIVSHAIDALMDRIGIDAAYRERTGCTLYTVEMHIHYLHEVKQADTAIVAARIPGADSKDRKSVV